MVPLLATALLILNSPAIAETSRFEVVVDPRVELLSAAMTQSPAWSAGLSGYFSPYAQETQKTFFPHRNHAAVKRLETLRTRVGMRELFAWVVSRGPLPDLAGVSSPYSEPTGSMGDSDALEKLAKDLTEFARAADFTAFFDRNEKLRTDITARIRLQVGAHDAAIDRLEKYTGVRRERYTVLAAPLLGNHTFSWSDSSGKQAYLLIAPGALREGRLHFDPTITSHAVYVGFGRPAAREAANSDPKRRDARAGWFPLLASTLRKRGISDWPETVSESFATAAAIRMWLEQGRAAEADALQRFAAARGLRLVPHLLPRLIEYETNRSRYHTLVDFAPRLFDVIDELEPVFSKGEPVDLGLADVGLTGEGVPVKSVRPGSPAATAGIRAGDTIQTIGGVRINGSESYLKAWEKWESAANGQSVPFRLKRGKGALTVRVWMKRAGEFQGFRTKGP